MAVCDVCKKRVKSAALNARLAIPEYRAVIGFWPWVDLAVCTDCLEAHDRDFRERLALLAPDVFENDEPVVRQVCLACATTASAEPWRQASKWVDADGGPVRRATFYLCAAHADLPFADGIVVASNLTSAARMAAVLDELPTAADALLARIERWRPADGKGPEGATAFASGRTRDEALADAMGFWDASPEGLEARSAWLGPIRRDYRMRYRLDLVRDTSDGRREVFTVVRTGPEEFATYRTAGNAPRNER